MSQNSIEVVSIRDGGDEVGIATIRWLGKEYIVP